MCLGLFVCVWVPRQIKLSYYDLQMKVAIAERLMEFKEGECPTVKFFLEFHVKTQGKLVAIFPVLTFLLYF